MDPNLKSALARFEQNMIAAFREAEEQLKSNRAAELWGLSLRLDLLEGRVLALETKRPPAA
jgi:hypothetical protein